MDYVIIIVVNNGTWMRKREGFTGEKAVILPERILRSLTEQCSTETLYVTDIGYYPSAVGHYRQRVMGCKQNILIYCVEGRGWFTIEGKRTEIKKNQFFVIPQDIPHCYGAYLSDPWTIYWLHYSGTYAVGYFGSEPYVGEILPNQFERISDRIRLFDELYSNLEAGFTPENLEHATAVLWHLLGSFKYVRQYHRLFDREGLDIIDQSIRFMQQNLHRSISLTELAANVGLSVSHYSLLFRLKVNQPPLDHLIHLRIRKACHLLDFTTMKIKEIAFATGYGDPFYFSRSFSRIMGQSPSDYRQKAKG